MNTVTILTPTYNREKSLMDLYTSLCAQDDMKFSWLVIDDGSSDTTEETISKLQAEAVFKIDYRKKTNGGKHTALNYAYQFIDTPLTFIVDSDDILTENAISTVEGIYQKYSSEKDLCGFSFLRKKRCGGLLSKSGVPYNGLKEDFITCRINRGISGDMAEVWYTDCLREFPFPEFTGEKFLGEDLVWIQMASKYKMRFFNYPISVTDYQEDGLTKNRRSHNIRSPKGCVARAEAFLGADVIWKSKIKAMLQYQIYGSFAGKTWTESFCMSSHRTLFLILWIPSRIIYYKWRKDYK